ncbi:Mitochondrial acidic protein mam33 [Chytridiales sp. JEL 0842]|nr:Mitochondrial acidic protein mam33 [Chytridiales sp. JEL 0842]
MSALRALRVCLPALSAVVPRQAIASISVLPRLTPTRLFSAAPVARSHGKGDRDLAHKLKEELNYELEGAEKAIPDFVKDFQGKGVFKIEDKRGEKEVTLTRNFGTEKISVIFSTDSLLDQSEFDEAEEEESAEKGFPVNMTILIEKKVGNEDAGSLEISATLQDQSFFIDSVSFSENSSIMVDQTAEGDWQRRGRYGGPVFQDLDEGLQELFHDFLAERGFDAALADFIPSYIEFKEQAEYIEWLKRVGEWVAK